MDNFNIPRYDGNGIYAIINPQKMKAYVGQTDNIKNRATQHKSNIQKGIHANKELQADKGDGFRFIVLHKCKSTTTEEELFFLEEIYMLSMLRKGFDLYNRISENGSNSEYIQNSIMIKLFSYIKSYENIDDAIYGEFGYFTEILKKRKPENRRRDNG